MQKESRPGSALSPITVRMTLPSPLPCGMISLSSFSVKYNEEKKYFQVITSESPTCPHDGGRLEYRDSVRRTVLNMYSEATLYLLRRLLCSVCGALHRELPNTIQPYKHYGSEVIQAVIDDSGDAACCAADDSTIRRWKSDFSEAEPDIKQRLTSVYSRMVESTVTAASSECILDRIRAGEKNWLAFVTGLLVNCGHKIRTRFAFCQRSFSATMVSAGKNKAGKGDGHVKTIKDTS